MLKYSQVNLEYGRGKEVSYNYQKLELEMAHWLVAGKALIDVENIREFEFHRELFHGSSTILQDIREKLPQEKLPYAKISAIRTDSRISDKAAQILAGLDFVMTFVKKTGNLSSFSGKEIALKTIAEYCKHWNLEVPELQKVSSISDISLQYLISLYEEVEDMIANTIAEWTDKAYSSTPLSGKEKEDIMILEQKSSLEVLVITFRRFIFRYLSAEKIDPEQHLSNFLPVLLLCWPHDKRDEVLLETFFPPSLLVSQTYSAYSFLRDKLEEQQKRQEAESTPKQAGPKSKTEIPKRRRDVF